MSGRKAGVHNEKSFLRKGIVGDWKNHFSYQSREKFNDYAGSSLLELGYEPDNTWVSSS